MSPQNPGQNGTKFRISSGPVVGEGLTDLPAALGDLARRSAAPLLFAIPRDPTSIFVYWSLDWDRVFSGGQPVDRQVFLRVRNQDGSEESEVVVEPMLGSHYATVASPGGSYRAEIGYYDSENGWRSVGVSDVIEMPRQGASENTDLDLVTVPMHLSFQRLIDMFRVSNGNALGSIISQLQAYESRDISTISEDESEILRAMKVSVEELAAARKSFDDDEALRRKTEAVLGFGATSPNAGFGDSGASPSQGFGDSSWS